MSIARVLLKKAEEIFGNLGDARILDVYTPLTIRDYVNAPEGCVLWNHALIATVTQGHVHQ